MRRHHMLLSPNDRWTWARARRAADMGPLSRVPDPCGRSFLSVTGGTQYPTVPDVGASSEPPGASCGIRRFSLEKGHVACVCLLVADVILQTLRHAPVALAVGTTKFKTSVTYLSSSRSPADMIGPDGATQDPGNAQQGLYYQAPSSHTQLRSSSIG